MAKTKLKDEQKGIIFLSLIAFIFALLAIAFILSLKTDTVAETLEADQVIRNLYVLENDDGGVLFSSVLVYYPETQKAAIVNVPSNTGAIYRSLEARDANLRGRFDAIENVYIEKGILTFKTEIERLLDMSIPFYTVIKLKDFSQLTDMLNGLRVFIPSPVDYIDENGTRFLLPSGAVNLDGDKIISYLKYKLPDEEDSNEQDRYQNVMAALLTSLHEKKYLVLNQKTFKIYQNFFTTNLDAEDEYRLFDLISAIDSESLIKQTVTGQNRTENGKTLLLPQNNGNLIKEAVKQTTNMLTTTGGTRTSRIYVLEIQNGTTRQRLAANTAILFQNASYDVLSTVNADRNNYEETVIIDHIGNEEIAKMLGEFIHCTNIREAEIASDEDINDMAANVDFTVILGNDFDGRYVTKAR